MTAIRGSVFVTPSLSTGHHTGPKCGRSDRTSINPATHDVSDLQGYHREIRGRWWLAYREGIENPIVVAVHKRSRLARERGLTDGEDFAFLALSLDDAARLGWPVEPTRANRPPHMLFLLATGDEVQAHLTSDLTDSGVIDAAHFDVQMRAVLRRQVGPGIWEGLEPFVLQPWRY